jgi:preprotein translocase subunit SecF
MQSSLKPKFKLQVIKQRQFWWSCSIAITIIGFIAMGISWAKIGTPLRPSLDFVGGSRIQYNLDCAKTDCNKPLNLDIVRDVLTAQGINGSSVQGIEKQGDQPPGILIKSATLSGEQQEKIKQALSQKLGELKVAQSDTVGPTLGKQLFYSSILALLVSFGLIMLYVAIRFDRDYAVFAIVALLHDVLLTLSVFAVLGLTLGVEVDSLFVVSLLTIVGFSMNDTVVIYDRVRETIQRYPGRHINDIVDEAVNQTLGRSINTTLTVLLSLVSIFLFGGETLKYFSLALIIGFTTGAYSSIFIATSLLAFWREKTGNAIAPALADRPSSSLPQV